MLLARRHVHRRRNVFFASLANAARFLALLEMTFR